MHRLCARRDVLPYVRYGPESSVEGLARYLKPSAYFTYILTLATTVARWGRRPARAHHPGRLEQDRPRPVPLLVHGVLVLLPWLIWAPGSHQLTKSRPRLKGAPPSRLVISCWSSFGVRLFLIPVVATFVALLPLLLLLLCWSLAGLL